MSPCGYEKFNPSIAICPPHKIPAAIINDAEEKSPGIVKCVGVYLELDI